MIGKIKAVIKDFTPFDSLLLGLAIYGLASSADVNMGMIIFRVFIPLALAFIIYGLYKMKLQFPKVNSFYGILFLFYWLLLLVMVVRGYLAPYSYWASPVKFLYDHIFNPTFVLGYLTPFFMLVPIQHIRFKYLLNINVVLMLVFLPTLVLSFNAIVSAAFAAQFEKGDNWISPASFVTSIYTATMFVLFLCNYISKKVYILNVICVLSCILALVIAARRGAVLICGLMLFLSLWAYFKRRKTEFLSLCGFLFIVLLFTSNNVLSNFLSFFDYIQERGLEDTRSVIDDELLSQLTLLDKVFGRGLLGRYRIQYDIVADAHGFRYYTETGFYYLVLRGGYLFALTHILLIFIPAIKAFFRARNDLVRMWSIYMLLSILELYPFGWPSLSLKFFLIWIGVAVCSNDRLLRMSDRQVKFLFFSKYASKLLPLKKKLFNDNQ
ncbi:MAG: hypothetical protein MJZ34_12945 [Paludibacteraceae bacterium]|nr:hypothetical protein [Paludibacteraceae bacterium]MCQ2218223.1 hypothetical protein [Paludibacteraceae bacterium]